MTRANTAGYAITCEHCGGTTGQYLTLSTPEVAEHLRIGESLVKRMLAAGEIPSIEVGRLRRVRWAELVEWVASRPTSLPGSTEVAA